MMGMPSLDALAMAGAEWAEARGVVAGSEEEEGGPPPEHLRAFEAFLEEVVPVDMMLAFGRERALQRGERSREEDIKEKLKLWAKAVARKTREEIRRSNNACACVR